VKVFVTGGTGYLGGAIARAFQTAGHQVSVLCRQPAQAASLARQGIQGVIGDMTTAGDWLNAVAEAEIVIHAAHLRAGMRLSSNWLKQSGEARDRCLRLLFDAAKRAGNCQLFIYTSGMVAHGDHGERVVDEDTPSLPSMMGNYHLEGERLTQEAFRSGLPTMVIRAGFTYGPDGSFGKFFLAEAEKGRYRFPGNGRNYLSFVHINDLARAYLLAAEKRPVGQIISVVDNEPMWLLRMAEIMLAEISPKGGKAIAMPSWLVALFAGSPLAEMLTSSVRVKNAKARLLLGWEPKYASVADGMRDVVRNYLALKAVKA